MGGVETVVIQLVDSLPVNPIDLVGEQMSSSFGDAEWDDVTWSFLQNETFDEGKSLYFPNDIDHREKGQKTCRLSKYDPLL